MDWETLYCPNSHCRGYGKPFTQGYLVKNGTSRGQPRACCKACGASVVLRYGTAYYGLDADPAIFETAVRALAEGNALRATARIVQVDKDTVCAWLDRFARHCRTVMLYFWHDLPVSECQLDELWSFVHTKEAQLPGAKIYCATYGDAWVWLAFAPVWRLVLAFVIGKRDQAGADLLLARVAHVTDDSIPLVTSDQLPEYRNALLNTYGEWYQPQRQGSRGAYPKPRLRPPPNLMYAQVVKRREGNRVVNVSTRVIFGTPEVVVVGVLSSGGTAHELARTVANARADSWSRIAAEVAPRDFSDGSGSYRACLDDARVARVSCASRIHWPIADHRTLVPCLGHCSSQQLRDTTRHPGCRKIRVKGVVAYECGAPQTPKLRDLFI
jgi:IS1 family transposase